MTKTTKDFIRKLERKLTVYAGKEMSHCGHDELIEKAMWYRAKMVGWVEYEFDRLAQKAGEP